MFGFLKDKLKQVVKKLTKDVGQEEGVAPLEESVSQEKEEAVEEPGSADEPGELEEPESSEKLPIDELFEEPEEPEEPEEVKKEEPAPEETKKEETALEDIKKEEPDEGKKPEVVEERPEPEVVKVKKKLEVVEDKEEPRPAEDAYKEESSLELSPAKEISSQELLKEKPPKQIEAEAKKLIEKAQKVQEEIESTDVLFEEDKTPAEELKKVEWAAKLEVKEEKKGFFDRIKSVFSKEEEEPKAEEEKNIELALLDEGLSEEEKEYIKKIKGEESAEEKVGEEVREPTLEEAVPAYEKEAEPEKLTEEKEETVKKKQKIEPKEPEEKGKPSKKGFFTKLTEAVTTKTLTEKQFDEIFWELEVGLMEANVAIEVIEKIKSDLKSSLVDQKVPRANIEVTITSILSSSIDSLFDVPAVDILAKAKEKKPLTIAFFGVNGAGKTTTIAKFAHWLKKHDKTCVLAAGDTFRAAAIQQLEEHANKLDVKIIKHDYGSDSAAVGFDAIKYAKQKGLDVVLIDTAGRLHSNVNLMDELKKIIRVCKPDVSLFVGESITGNDCIEQAKKFDDAVGVDGIILTKADVDDKGGAAVSVSFVTKKPILFLGMGQGYDDLKEFDKSIVLGSLELS